MVKRNAKLLSFIHPNRPRSGFFSTEDELRCKRNGARLALEHAHARLERAEADLRRYLAETYPPDVARMQEE